MMSNQPLDNWLFFNAQLISNSGYYEILNEPHGITTAVWCQIQLKVINAIRAINTKHTIIVGPSGYNSYNELKNMPVYADTNLIYTFHFYDPFMFTHQGASWTSGMQDVANVPFPYNASKMPATPASAKGTWVDLDTEILTSLNFNWQQTIMNSISGSKATHPTPDLRSVLLIRKRPLQAIIRGESVTPLIKAGCRKFSFNIFEK